ncbi:2-oxoglutarate (2OG) and Fe(II)-dependent oxygenase superfamily protein [Melia azedarach]|uniref:2-oxoglutarate (2OG) and Fe(II)-dependent oxygenase superfamily protein n=1 Tax=Melia azedarach TaxID=155640 RepID=A0ACC1X581_MELAZ|nr:2-oxoglutarate (2OG) and Fe(II)-dependent oxygenase superfamily protein [Melia azedarach]
MDNEQISGSFTIGNSAQERGLSYVPECYKVPSSHRPSLAPEIANIPIIDLAKLRQGDEQRLMLTQEIGNACRRMGFFQVVNHGICQSVLDEVLSSAAEFFNLPTEEKQTFMSNDVYKAVRYGTSLKDGVDKIQFWRIFLKHYAHPLDDWILSWPKNPSNYKKNMGKYSTEVRKLALELMGAITESLGIGPTYLGKKMDEGMQVMIVNCYPPCPQPDVALGLPPHSDYSCLTIVLQSTQGLQILDKDDGAWKMVPEIHGALQVHVGDHLEVLSNGIYKSVVHRAILNREKTRISIASLHSLGMDEKMETAKELVDEKHPKGYNESSFNDFLSFFSRNDVSVGESFLNTLRIKK